MVYKTLNDLGPVIPLTSSPTTAPCIHSAIATRVSLLFPKHRRHASPPRAFALAVPSAWHAPYPDVHMAT